MTPLVGPGAQQRPERRIADPVPQPLERHGAADVDRAVEQVLGPGVVDGQPPELVVGLELHVRRVEEPYLLRTHGDAYRTYAASAGRFVPGIGRLAHGTPGGARS